MNIQPIAVEIRKNTWNKSNTKLSISNGYITKYFFLTYGSEYVRDSELCKAMKILHDYFLTIQFQWVAKNH